MRRAQLHSERVGEALIGKLESDANVVAEAEGITVRIACREGVHFPLRTSYQPSRVNLTIEDGMVTAVSVG